MTASAWMPIYLGDYLGKTARLTTEQHGAYLLLIFDYWRNGPPPADDAVLAQITRLSRPAWKKIRPIILAFFEERDGKLFHDRVEEELHKAGENQERRTQKAKKGAAARWSKQGDDDAPSNARSNATSIPEAMPNECAPPSPYSVSKDTGQSPSDPAKLLFDAGVKLLTDTGQTEKSARALLGKWRGQVGDDEVRVAIAEATIANISDTVPYLTKRFAGKHKPNGEPGDFLQFKIKQRQEREAFAARAGATG